MLSFEAICSSLLEFAKGYIPSIWELRKDKDKLSPSVKLCLSHSAPGHMQRVATGWVSLVVCRHIHSV